VEWPDRAGCEAIVVEDPQRPEAHLLRVDVVVEREVPARREPAAVRSVDLVRGADGEHQAAAPAVSEPASSAARATSSAATRISPPDVRGSRSSSSSSPSTWANLPRTVVIIMCLAENETSV